MASRSAAHQPRRRRRRYPVVGPLLAVAASLVSAAGLPPLTPAAGAATTTGSAASGWCTAGVAAVPTARFGTESSLTAIDATDATNVWAVGQAYDEGVAGYRPYVVRGDGSQMELVPVPRPTGTDIRLEGVSTPDPHSTWIAGTIAPVDATSSLPFIAHWNGTDVTAEVLPASITDSHQLSSGTIDAWSDRDVWFVGTDDATPGSRQGFALHRRGDQWSVTTVPGAQVLDTVHAVGPEDAYAGGEGLWHWDGAAWSAVPAVPPTAMVVDVTGNAGDVTVLYGDSVDGPFHLLHGDGTTWSEQALPHLPGVDRTRYEAISQAPDGTVWVLLRAKNHRVSGDHYVVARRTGSTWVSLAQGDGDALGQSEGDVRFPEDLVALSRADIRTAGPDYAQTELQDGTPHGSVLRLCAPTIVATSVVHPRVVSSIGATFLVLGGPGLTGRWTVSDDLGLVHRSTLAAGGAVRLGYPIAGSFTATVSRSGATAADVEGTIRTAVGLQTYGTRIRWADAPPPAGYVIQAQVQRPGATGFQPVRLADPHDVSVVLARTAAPGTYHYRARVIRTVDGLASGWSPVLAVVR